MNKEDLFIIGIGNCNRCGALKRSLPEVQYYQLPDKLLGLGDVIDRIAYLLNIKKCKSCTVRHLWLNKYFPFFWAGTKEDRNIKNKLIKLNVRIYPILTDFNFSQSYNIDDYSYGFTKMYPEPE